MTDSNPPVKPLGGANARYMQQLMRHYAERDHAIPEQPLRALWSSTFAFLWRMQDEFDIQPLEAAVSVFEEEFNEVMAEIEAYSEGMFSKESLAEEAADLIVTLIAVFSKVGVDWADMVAACYKVAAKNENKDSGTHYMDEQGKFSRRASK